MSDPIAGESASRFLGLWKRQDAPRPNEIMAHEWLSQKTLWDVAKQGVEEAERQRIDSLFPKTPVWASGAEEWYNLNSASQEVGKYLTHDQLSIEFTILLQLARDRQLSNVAAYVENAPIFKTLDDVSLGKKRANYLALLDDLQRSFIDGRYSRSLKREVADRLLVVGARVGLLALAPLALYYLYFKFTFDPAKVQTDAAKGYLLFSANPAFGIGMVASFGLLGAYFSRVVGFQNQLKTLRFDDVVNTYQTKLLYVRLFCGTIGAIVFYFFLRSGIIGGSAFPDLGKISIGEEIIWKFTPSLAANVTPNRTPDPSGLTVLMPTIELAKLLVWSFIAGFSERLVPDALAQTATKADGKTS